MVYLKNDYLNNNTLFYLTGIRVTAHVNEEWEWKDWTANIEKIKGKGVRVGKCEWIRKCMEKWNESLGEREVRKIRGWNMGKELSENGE